MRGKAAIGEGNTCSGGGGERRGDTGNHFKFDASCAESLNFFGGAAEEQRVATLEANNDLVLCGGSNEERVDVVLREQSDAATFADVDAFSSWRDESKDFGADERVVQNNAGRLE